MSMDPQSDEAAAWMWLGVIVLGLLWAFVT